MNSREAHKRLLVATSDLNRILLVEDLASLRTEIRTATAGIAAIGSLTASAASLASGLSAFRSGIAGASTGTPWWQNLISSSGLLASLWNVFRPSRSRDGHAQPRS